MLSFFALKTKGEHFAIGISRGLISFLLLATPLLYDGSVPEVAGDLRWYTLHIFTLLAATFCFLGFAFQKTHFPSRLPLAVWAIVVLVFAAIFSTIDTYNLIRSWWFLKHMLGYCSLFILIYALREEKWLKSLLWIIIIPIIPNGVLVFFQFHGITNAEIPFHLPLIDYFRQAAIPGATLSNKNLVASWLVLVMPISLYLFASTHLKSWKNILSGLCFALGFMAFIYARSRVSYMAFLIMLIFTIVIIAIKKPYRQAFFKLFTPIKGIIIVVIAIAAIIAGSAPSVIKEHSIKRSLSEQIVSISHVKEYKIRMAYNINNLAIIRDHWLNGTGIGSFHTVYPKYHQAITETPFKGYNIAARPQRAHNDFMQAFVEMGPVGGLAFLVLFISVIIMVWRMGDCTEKLGLMPLFVGSGIIGICINSLGDFPLQMPVGPIILWASAGLLTAYYTMYSKPQTPTLKFTLPRFVWLSLCLITFIISLFIINQSVDRRTASQHLKNVIMLAQNRIYNQTILREVNRAHDVYPHISRLNEYRGVVLMNLFNRYRDQMSLDNMIEEIEGVLKTDPFAANNLVNLGSLYHHKSMRADQYGEPEKKRLYAQKILEIHRNLLILSPNNINTYMLGGAAYLVLGKSMKALKQYDKALELEPDNQAAQQGRAMAAAFLMQEQLEAQNLEKLFN